MDLVRLQFEADLEYQRAAIDAVVGLFEGQPRLRASRVVRRGRLVIGNELALDGAALLRNLRRVQARDGIEPAGSLRVTESLRGALDPRGGVPHFSIEMETGTGKTYVYLRTILELRRAYGFRKFVVVVPSVAIREGVRSTVSQTAAHFAEIYGRGRGVHARVYRSRALAGLREFAQSDRCELLILNIDAFNKPAFNLMHQPQDALGGARPIELIQASAPVVIVDEPQNMESALARAAIRSLNPLCTLRYSATHRERYNLVYQLGPVAAHALRLVKRIEVASVADAGAELAPIELLSVEPGPSGPVARIRIRARAGAGTRRRTIAATRGEAVDLYALSRGIEGYRGCSVGAIDLERGEVRLTSGRVVARVSAGDGGRARERRARAQIELTIREHLERELLFRALPPARRVKVLSLFFLDRVADYADEDGVARRRFVEAYRTIGRAPRYQPLALPPVERVHGGYFARDRKGRAKDTRGRSRADDEVYALIMRDKQRLLSASEPLRFIFSHSALREGWDNPNVFQICTLSRTRSKLKKRQEIGRGLRLPVMANGARCRDAAVNRLTIIANESYETFARALQREVEDDWGEPSTAAPIDVRRRRVLRRAPPDDRFLALWRAICPRTRFTAPFSSEALIEASALALRQAPALAPAEADVARRAELDARGGSCLVEQEPNDMSRSKAWPSPALLEQLQRELLLTRRTLAAILTRSARNEDASRAPEAFFELARRVIAARVEALSVAAVRYQRIDGPGYAHGRLSPAITADAARVLPLERALYGGVVCSDARACALALALDRDPDTRLFFRLPRWFVIPTPLGDFAPGWACLSARGGPRVLALAPASTGSRGGERWAAFTRCARAHFECLGGVEFRALESLAELG